MLFPLVTNENQMLGCQITERQCCRYLFSEWRLHNWHIIKTRKSETTLSADQILNLYVLTRQ